MAELSRPSAIMRQLSGWKPDVPDDWTDRKKEPGCLTASWSCHSHNLPTSRFISFLFFLDFIYLFLERGKGGRKKGRETSMCGCLWHSLLGTWTATQVWTGASSALFSSLASGRGWHWVGLLSSPERLCAQDWHKKRCWTIPVPKHTLSLSTTAE